MVCHRSRCRRLERELLPLFAVRSDCPYTSTPRLGNITQKWGDLSRKSVTRPQDSYVGEGTCVGRCKGLQKASAFAGLNISKTKDLAKSYDPTTALELLKQLPGGSLVVLICRACQIL